VQLTLLLDQGEEATGPRWQPASQTFSDLSEVLTHIPNQPIVVLGSPGSGKSTLLRHFELNHAREMQARPAGDDLSQMPLTFFVPLNDYKPDRLTRLLPPPLDWLAARWESRFPDLPPLKTLLQQHQLTLLLDALNEIPAAGISARISCNVLKLSGILHGLTMSSSPIGDPDHAVAPHQC
jgi:predicted NACHT family NTPase